MRLTHPATFVRAGKNARWTPPSLTSYRPTILLTRGVGTAHGWESIPLKNREVVPYEIMH